MNIQKITKQNTFKKTLKIKSTLQAKIEATPEIDFKTIIILPLNFSYLKNFRQHSQIHMVGCSTYTIEPNKHLVYELLFFQLILVPIVI